MPSFNNPNANAQAVLNSSHQRGQQREHLANEHTAEAEETAPEEVSKAVFNEYVCYSLDPEVGCAHPGAVSESAPLAAVKLPDAEYPLLQSLPARCIQEGWLSRLQLEGALFACQKHQQLLADDVSSRAGFMLGDGAGIGKGRQLAAIIFDNYCRGRRRAVWLSTSADLSYAAERDLRDIGCQAHVIHNISELDSLKASKRTDGVLFCTYHSLVSKTGKQSRLEQIIDWLGGEFDGPLILDEAHRAKHFKEHSSSVSTKVGKAVVDIQRRLPKARVVYASATSVSEVSNMAYLTRLGLWGRGTEFTDASSFIESTAKKGTSFLELVAMELKAKGALVARSLSFSQCEFYEAHAALTPNEIRMYNEAAKYWQRLAQELDAELRDTGAPATAQTQFWSVSQRFFRALTCSLKIRTLCSKAKSAVANGWSCVIGLQSTGEAALERHAEQLNDHEFVPVLKDMVKQFILQYWPVAHEQEEHESYRKTQKSEHNLLSEKQAAVPVQKCGRKEKMLRELEELKLPTAFLDNLIDNLGGSSAVSEMTGRRQRHVRNSDGKIILQQRNEDLSEEGINLKEYRRFQDGKKAIAIISEAASTGISLHADPRSGSAHRRRLHITVETAWSAEATIQQLGRTHRSAQRSGPVYALLSTSIGGEVRFISAVARRLESLGALSKGDRRAAASIDLSSSNIDSTLGRKALRSIWEVVSRSASYGASDTCTERLPLGVRVDELRSYAQTAGLSEYRASTLDAATANSFFREAGAKMYLSSSDGRNIQQKDSGDMRKTMNRMLQLEVHEQALVLAYLWAAHAASVRNAKAEGKLGNEAVTEIKASSITRVANPRTLFRPMYSSLDTIVHLLQFDRGMTYDEACTKLQNNRGAQDGFYASRREIFGRTAYILALQKEYSGAFAVYRPNTGVSPFEMESEELHDKYIKATDHEKAREGWEALFELTASKCIHGESCTLADRCRVGRRFTHCALITGSVLPVWATLESVLERYKQSLPKADQSVRVARVRLSDTGERLIGVRYHANLLEEVQQRLVEAKKKDMSTTSEGSKPTTEAPTAVDHSLQSKLQKRAPTITDFFAPQRGQ